MVVPAQIPKHLIALVERAINFAAIQIAQYGVFYPFASVSEKGKFDCVMTDHHPGTTQPSDMIETLQWQLIDIALERPLQTALTYAATLPDGYQTEHNAVAMELSDEKDKNYFIVFTYKIENGKLVFSKPLTEDSSW